VRRLLTTYLRYVDRYIYPDYPRGSGTALRDLRWIWVLHLIPALLIVWLVELTLPPAGWAYWLKLVALLSAFAGFPLFAFVRHGQIRRNVDRRFDEMPGIFGSDGREYSRFPERDEDRDG